MSYYIATIPFSNIKKIFVHVTSCKKTMSQTYSELKAKYPNNVIHLINGGMWNPDGSPCVGLKVDGKLLSKTPWGNVPGYGWDDASNFCMTLDWKNYKNYIACSHLIQKGQCVEIPYDAAQGGTRGRTAIGIKDNNLILYCSQDGTKDAKTPEKLQQFLASKGLSSAIMLDSGGSSMCNFNGYTIKGDGRKVHNWLVVVLNNQETEQKEDTVTKDTGKKIIKNYITNNPCYTSMVKTAKSKMMLHSTGTPGGTASAIANGMNKKSASTSVEFIIDDTGVYQLLPLGIKSWHCGSSGNNTHIGCEICEPIQTRLIDINWKPLYRNGKYNTTWAVTQLQKELQAWGYDPNGIDGNFGPGCEAALKKFQSDHGLTADGSCGNATKNAMAKRQGSYLKYNPDDTETKAFFDNAYSKAVWLFANILKQVGGKSSDIVCHSEGYKLKIASNHADVEHWFPLHGKTMDVFRKDVENEMNGNTEQKHWAQDSYDNLIKRGVKISDTRFDDNITRGEVFALADKILQAIEK